MSVQAPALGSPLPASSTPWYRTITADQWRALIAAKLGWMLDAMDFVIYVMAIGRLQAYFGFDAATEEYTDMISAGILDPAKVTRTALQNAASISGLMLTTEALVSEIPEEEKAPAGPPMGGAPGMY